MRYYVISPEMWRIEPVLDDGSGPKEFFRNYVEVEAHDAFEAKVKAVRSKSFAELREWQKNDDKSPYSGVKAMRVRSSR